MLIKYSPQERNKDSSSLEMTTMNGIMQVNHTSPGTSMVESIAAGTNSHDVIQRLDSLVNGTQYTSSEQINIKEIFMF